MAWETPFAGDFDVGTRVTAVDCGSPTVLARVWHAVASRQECQRWHVERLDGTEVAVIQCGDAGCLEALCEGDH